MTTLKPVVMKALAELLKLELALKEVERTSTSLEED